MDGPRRHNPLTVVAVVVVASQKDAVVGAMVV